MNQFKILILSVVLHLGALSVPGFAWNIPGHMLSGAIAYRILEAENPAVVSIVETVLEKHPVNRLRRIATDLRNRFPRASLSELRNIDPGQCANESYEAAIQIAYQSGKLRGTPNGQHRECREVAETTVPSYAATARRIADPFWCRPGDRYISGFLLLDHLCGESHVPARHGVAEVLRQITIDQTSSPKDLITSLADPLRAELPLG